jgi:alpha-L-fucosidase
MDVNGEAIYGSRPWKISEEGRVHFTAKGDSLYAISLDWPEGELAIPALGEGKGTEGGIEKVELLGGKEKLSFTRNAAGLHVKFPDEKPCDVAYAVKITGLKLPPPAKAAGQPA